MLSLETCVACVLFGTAATFSGFGSVLRPFSHITEKDTDRARPLGNSSLEAIPRAKVLLTGVVSYAQLEFAILYKKRHPQSIVVAYVDHFEPQTSERIEMIKQFAGQAQAKIAVCTTEHVVALEKHKIAAMYVGQPTVRTWQQNVSLQMPSEAVLAFFGGYGENPSSKYCESFEEFIEWAAEENTMAMHPWKIIFCPHPKVDGSWERELFKKMNLQVEYESNSLVGAQRCRVAVTVHSSVGFQLLGLRPVIFFHIDPHYRNIAIDLGLGAHCSCRDALGEALLCTKRTRPLASGDTFLPYLFAVLKSYNPHP